MHSNQTLSSKCWLTAVLVLEVCTDFGKIRNALLFGKRNLALSKFNTVDLLVYIWCCVGFTDVQFLDWKIHTMVQKFRADLTKR